VPQDYAQAVQWYHKAVEVGHPAAQNSLGFCYGKGHGVPQDYAQAAQWYLKAAEQGAEDEEYARCFLFLFYDKGQGVPRDGAQVVQLYRKVAEQGKESAQFNLGCCYVYGRGVAKNPVIACKWFRLAAERGHSGAKEQFAALSALMSPAELAESKRLYEEYWKRRQF
jgi:hypothetical protein